MAFGIANLTRAQTTSVRTDRNSAQVGRVGSTVGNITQRVVVATADKRQKLALVVAALGERSGRSLVFVEKKRTATWLKKMARPHGARTSRGGVGL